MLQAKSLYHMRGRIDEIPRGRWLTLLKAIHRLVGTVSQKGTDLSTGFSQTAYRHAHRVRDVHISWLIKAKVCKDSVEVRLANESLRVVVLLRFFIDDDFGTLAEQPVKTAMDDDQVGFGSWTRRCDSNKEVAELGGPNKVPQPERGHLRAFPGHPKAREHLVDGRQREVAGRRAGWEHLGMRIPFIERIRLLFPRMNGSSEAVEDGFHLVYDLGVGRIVNSILQKPTSEGGVSEKRRFALVLRFGRVAVKSTDSLADGIIWQGPLLCRRAE